MSEINVTAKNFEEEVLHSTKPVLLDFWAPWCGPCQMMLPIVEQIAAEHEEIKVGKINIDENMDLAKKFKVMSIPTLIVMKNGEITNRSVGAIAKEKVLEML